MVREKCHCIDEAWEEVSCIMGVCSGIGRIRKEGQDPGQCKYWKEHPKKSRRIHSAPPLSKTLFFSSSHSPSHLSSSPPIFSYKPRHKTYTAATIILTTAATDGILKSSSLMAVVLPPYQSRAQGILLNPSPSASPYHHPSSLPALLPSNSSLSSSTSSSSHLPSDSDYFSTPPTPASNPTSPMAQPQHLHPYSNAKPTSRSQHNDKSHPAKSRSGSQPASMRRIRFAPLPDPRREVGYTVSGAEVPLGQIFYDDSNDAEREGEDELRRPSELGLNLGVPFVRRSPPQSLLLDNSSAGGTGYTSSPNVQLTSILLNGSPNASTSALSTPLQNVHALSSPDLTGTGEWQTIPSESVRVNSVDEPTPCHSKASSITSGSSTTSKWTRRFLKPLLKGLSTDEESLSRTTSNTSTATATTPTSAASENGFEGCFPRRSSKSSSRSGGSRSSSRPREKRDPDWIREFGMPLGRWSSDVTYAVTPGAEHLANGGFRRVGQMNVSAALARSESLTLTEMTERFRIIAKQKREEREAAAKEAAAREAATMGQSSNADTNTNHNINGNASTKPDAKTKANVNASGAPMASQGRKQTRLLNGRVYGAKRNQNLFANIRYVLFSYLYLPICHC